MIMKNKMALLLIIAAVPLYLWDSHMLLSGLLGKGKKSLNPPAVVTQNDDFQRPAAIAHFVNKGRSPFMAYKELPRPAAVLKSVAKKPQPAKTVTVPLHPPKITVTGIMWNPTNPIAMVTLPDGSSAAVKVNQAIGTIRITRIEKTRICVVVDGAEFWIQRD
jgi:hypothetical protein